jgi:hypothetical protein
MDFAFLVVGLGNTQGPAHARQVIYHLDNATALFLL